MGDLDTSIPRDQAGTASAEPQRNNLHLLGVTEDADRTPLPLADPIDWLANKVIDKVKGTTTLREEVANRFGVEIQRRNGNSYQYSYRAGGEEHIVANTADNVDGLHQAEKELQKLADTKMQELESKFHVKFATPGEDVERAVLKSADCQYSEGEMVHAATPTLPQLYAMEVGLSHSAPSQLGPDGVDGVKIYFLDKQPLPPITEGKFALGMFVRSDKDNHRAFYVTPEGGRLAPTKADTTVENERDLASCVEHELTHNSQQNMWSHGRMPDEMAFRMGWQKKDYEIQGHPFSRWTLTANDGHEFAQGNDDCKLSPVWFRLDNEGYALDKLGNRVAKLKDAEVRPGAELRNELPIKAPTYYFTNPKEMMSEALTSFRHDAATRASLLRESPTLYGVVSSYDQQELDKYYGVDEQGKSKYIRSPEGFAVPRTSAVEEAVISLERNNSMPY